MNEIHKPEQKPDNPELRPKPPEAQRERESQLKRFGAELDNASPEPRITDNFDSVLDKNKDGIREKTLGESPANELDRFGRALDGTNPVVEETSHDNSFLGFGKKEYVPGPVERIRQESKDRINKEVLPAAGAEVDAHIYNNGLYKYVLSRNKLDAGLAGSTKALTPPEMQRAYGRSWSSEINGFSNGRESFIDCRLNPEEAKETAIHEYYHHLSANDTYKWNGKIADSKRGISINDNDRGLNEALTQKYTLDTMRDSDPTYENPKCAYHDATRYIDKFYSYEGNQEMFDKAYFQNNPDMLRQHFDGYCGDGFYDRLSHDFDIITLGPNGPREEAMYRKALSDIQLALDEYDISR